MNKLKYGVLTAPLAFSFTFSLEHSSEARVTSFIAPGSPHSSLKSVVGVKAEKEPKSPLASQRGLIHLTKSLLLEQTAQR